MAIVGQHDWTPETRDGLAELVRSFTYPHA